MIDFAFNHAESARSFRAAQALDPECAMCFWGEALALGPNINVTSNGKVVMSDDERTSAFAAIQRAVALRENVTEAERVITSTHSLPVTTATRRRSAKRSITRTLAQCGNCITSIRMMTTRRHCLQNQ